MKSAAEIKSIIIDFAQNNENIRAVLLNGSRANPNIKKDNFQDYDIRFVVKDFDEFIKDHSWTGIFGNKIIEQLPETFSFGDKQEDFFSYLMLFEGLFRIDLSVIPLSKRDSFNESLTVVWLDKDRVYKRIAEPSDKDFWVKKPDEKWFREVCNEFWWVTTYVAKGLARNEIPFAIKHQEEILRPMLMQMLDWKIGLNHIFEVSTGKAGKFYPKYLGNDEYTAFLETYSDAKTENVWKSMFKMTEIFSKTAKIVASKMQFNYEISEEENVLNYLLKIYKNPLGQKDC